MLVKPHSVRPLSGRHAVRRMTADTLGEFGLSVRRDLSSHKQEPADLAARHGGQARVAAGSRKQRRGKLLVRRTNVTLSPPGVFRKECGIG